MSADRPRVQPIPWPAQTEGVSAASRRNGAAAAAVATANVDGMRAPQEGEVLWAQSEGQVVNFWTFLLCGFLAWLVLPIFYAAFKAWLTSRHAYQLTDQRLTESKGVLLRDTEQLELYRVKDIAVVEPFVQRLFGCGRVVLITSDRSTPLIQLNAVSEPHAVADLIRQCVQACRVANGVREVDA